ncbi:hypothetical protein RB597_009157 [Gaeumannomyces tritici]
MGNYTRPGERPPLKDRSNNVIPPNMPAGHGSENVDPSRSRYRRVKAPPSTTAAPPPNPRLSAISKDSRSTADSKRASQVSAASNPSTTSSGFRKPKTHVGPWQLGKTLGKGSSARVRLARHHVTQQYVAVKIVAKSVCQITQAGSLAKLDEIESAMPEDVNGMRRMPLSIEREVAILKLIDHPNIVKIYDIWENRDEIYLILEYVEKGDLFAYIARNGPLSEEQAMFIFRQIMSAVQYCHSFGICHRDLKPENILLKEDGTVKIADFGMAALHQGPGVPLVTSCGSPHYAAPELLSAKAYRGEKSDIWSMGVILFVMMAARLPFDDDDVRVMLSKAKKGIYEMPRWFSPGAKDLIHCILQVNPSRRISMADMWEHPFTWKFGYLDELSNCEGGPDPRLSQNTKPLDLCNIDPQILRPLQSVWHTFSEDELISTLISEGNNDQKLFYWLLHNYRERYLEDYKPSLTHSESDYHHLRPPQYSTRVSTRQFLTNKANGTGRSISKFTVISNVPEKDATGPELGTVRSYDPYRASIKSHPKATHAKIVIHRDATGSVQRSVSLGSTAMRRARGASSSGSYLRPRKSELGNRRLTAGTTVSSAPSSRHMQPRTRAAPRYKRAMDFSGVRNSRRRSALSRDIKAPASIAGDESTYDRDVTSPSSHCRPSRQSCATSASVKIEISPANERDGTMVLTEELRHFSSSIAKDCDEAFNSSLLSETPLDGRSREGSPFSLSLGPPTSPSPATPSATPTAPRSSLHPWDSRPLPPTPPSSGHKNAPAAAFHDRFAPAGGHQRAGQPRFSSSHRSGITPSPAERRVVSAPVHGPYGGREMGHLPAINENDDPNKSRIVSAPARSPARVSSRDHENRALSYLSRAEQTIRVVHSPSSKLAAPAVEAAAAVPQPLKIRKKSSVTSPQERPLPDPVPSVAETRRQVSAATSAQTRPELTKTASQGSASTFAMRKKTSTWFKRLSRDSKESNEAEADGVAAARSDSIPQRMDSCATQSNQTDSASTRAMPPPPPQDTASKKRSFLFQFWKSSRSQPRMSLVGPGYEDAVSSERLPSGRQSRMSSRLDVLDLDEQEQGGRKIKPQQNWLARLFKVKPATRTICLTMPRRRARQDIAIMLRDWRRFGMRDVEVDKERNIVFARVGAKNHLQLKEVSFACEFITVIEHGKRNHLSIVRFTQEEGAASSFQKVVDTILSVFTSRGLLVTDKRKAKMMIKTLNS